MKTKTLFFFGSILLVFLGGFIDYQRYTMMQNTGLTGNPVPAIWFDIVSNIVFMALLLFVANIAMQYKLPFLGSLLFLFIGLFLTVFPALLPPLSPVFNSFPPKTVNTFQYLRLYTSLAGAFLLILGILNTVRNVRK